MMEWGKYLDHGGFLHGVISQVNPGIYSYAKVWDLTTCLFHIFTRLGAAPGRKVVQQ